MVTLSDRLAKRCSSQPKEECGGRRVERQRTDTMEKVRQGQVHIKILNHAILERTI
jgi:hypothetical protein